MAGGTSPTRSERRARVAAKVEELVTAGASVFKVFDDDEHWVVMQDPEGNEFCVQ